MNSFISTIKPIISQHYQAVIKASDTACCVCKAPTTQAIITPMSWLHVSDPFVNVICRPACNKPECDTKIRQDVQIFMSQVGEMPTSAPPPAASSARSGSNNSSGISEIKPCRVCNKIENTFRCSRCRIAFYCGKEHQKADWPLHKVACKKSAGVA